MVNLPEEPDLMAALTRSLLQSCRMCGVPVGLLRMGVDGESTTVAVLWEFNPSGVRTYLHTPDRCQEARKAGQR